MFYYLVNGMYIATSAYHKDWQRISIEEYEEATKQYEPTEEEIRKQKEEELRRLLRELYPEEEEK